LAAPIPTFLDPLIRERIAQVDKLIEARKAPEMLPLFHYVDQQAWYPGKLAYAERSVRQLNLLEKFHEQFLSVHRLPRDGMASKILGELLAQVRAKDRVMVEDLEGVVKQIKMVMRHLQDIKAAM
jgi:hypothetical protein